MEELRGARLHYLRGDGRCRRLFDDCAKLRNTLPVAVVIEKTAGRVVTLLDLAAGVPARLSEVALDACRNVCDPVAEDASQAHRAITLEGVDVFWVDGV